MKDLEMALKDGGIGVVDGVALTGLDARFNGDLVMSDHAQYDETRSIWNGMINKHPAVIARCMDAADVAECVRFAQEHRLLVSVRGGGHNYAGKSLVDQGFVIDLSTMRDIEVDPSAKTVRVGGGCRLGEFDEAAEAKGLGTTLGVNTDTGVAGLTLGGGYGWLAGRFGLACDNLRSINVVSCDGDILTADAERNSDLFWGMRGAGANLAIATSLTFNVHPLGEVLGGLILYPLSQGKSFLRFFDDYAHNCPDELTLIGLMLTAPDGSPAVGAGVCYSGTLERGAEVLKPLRNFATPLADLIEPKPYTLMQQLFDDAWPPGRSYYNKSHIFEELNDDAIEVLLEYASSFPTTLSSIVLQQVHGAATRVPVDATAFPHRYHNYACYVHPATDDPSEHDQIVTWARSCWDAVRPFAAPAVYVNALEDGLEEGEARVREAYGANFDRLCALKTRYDPTNLLRMNSNIVPG